MQINKTNLTALTCYEISLCKTCLCTYIWSIVQIDKSKNASY